jgi:hypothetical protein
LLIKDEYEDAQGAYNNKEIIKIIKLKGSDTLNVSLMIDKDSEQSLPNYLAYVSPVEKALKEILFGRSFINPFIISAERTGASIFQNELDFVRNRILETLKTEEKPDLFSYFKKSSPYPLPVRDNVDFARDLKNITKTNSSPFQKDVTDNISDIIGGRFKVTADNISFIPKNNGKLRLHINECSSSVRSLMFLYFYLLYKAKPGDFLIIDEPELNLHPSNQRKIARLFAKLINKGIKLLITTHSDYIIKRLNTLIMLKNNPSPL